MTESLMIPVPARELEDLLKRLTALIDVLVERELDVPEMVALLDMRDACKALANALPLQP